MNAAQTVKGVRLTGVGTLMSVGGRAFRRASLRTVIASLLISPGRPLTTASTPIASPTFLTPQLARRISTRPEAVGATVGAHVRRHAADHVPANEYASRRKSAPHARSAGCGLRLRGLASGADLGSPASEPQVEGGAAVGEDRVVGLVGHQDPVDHLPVAAVVEAGGGGEAGGAFKGCGCGSSGWSPVVLWTLLTQRAPDSKSTVSSIPRRRLRSRPRPPRTG